MANYHRLWCFSLSLSFFLIKIRQQYVTSFVIHVQ